MLLFSTDAGTVSNSTPGLSSPKTLVSLFQQLYSAYSWRIAICRSGTMTRNTNICLDSGSALTYHFSVVTRPEARFSNNKKRTDVARPTPDVTT
jgi:hypothetical protein